VSFRVTSVLSSTWRDRSCSQLAQRAVRLVSESTNNRGFIIIAKNIEKRIYEWAIIGGSLDRSEFLAWCPTRWRVQRDWTISSDSLFARSNAHSLRFDQSFDHNNRHGSRIPRGDARSPYRKSVKRKRRSGSQTRNNVPRLIPRRAIIRAEIINASVTRNAKRDNSAAGRARDSSDIYTRAITAARSAPIFIRAR
jgi:hypothetical protein